MLTALVVDRMPNGSALLSIGGRQFVATTDIPVQPGSRIQLEVQMLTPNLVLKVAGETTQAGASSQPAPVAQPLAANPLIAGQAASASGLLNAIAGDASLRATLARAAHAPRQRALPSEQVVQELSSGQYFLDPDNSSTASILTIALAPGEKYKMPIQPRPSFS